MFGLIGMIIVGGIIGWIAGLILGKDVPGGILGNIIAGIVGSWVGTMILGEWGPQLGKHLSSIIRFNYFNLYYFINFKSTKKKIISID